MTENAKLSARLHGFVMWLFAVTKMTALIVSFVGWCLLCAAAPCVLFAWLHDWDLDRAKDLIVAGVALGNVTGIAGLLCAVRVIEWWNRKPAHCATVRSIDILDCETF